MLLSNDGMLCQLEKLKQRAPIHLTTDEYILFNLRPTSLSQGFESVLFALDRASLSQQSAKPWSITDWNDNLISSFTLSLATAASRTI